MSKYNGVVYYDKDDLVEVKVEVTSDDISKGEIGCANACPVALAIERVCDTFYGYYPDVQGDTVTFWNGDVMNLRLPLEVAEFIDRFDNKKIVSPFEFHVDLPTKVLNSKTLKGLGLPYK